MSADSLDEKIKASCHSRAELLIGDTIPRPIERDDLSGETIEASDQYCADPCGKDDLSGETVEAPVQYRADQVAESAASRPDGGILETSVHLVAEKAEQQPSLSNGSVPADSVGDSEYVVTPTLREQELGWSTERCEKMSLRDADPTPD